MSTEKEHIDQLREAIERMHGGSAQLTQFRSRPRDIRRQDGMGRRGARLRPHRASDRDSRLRVVLADRGKRQAAVLCRAAYGSDQLALGSGASGNRRRASRQDWSLRGRAARAGQIRTLPRSAPISCGAILYPHTVCNIFSGAISGARIWRQSASRGNTCSAQ